MLELTTYYTENSPIAVWVGNVTNFPLHFHYDTEFIFVLRGSMKLKCGSSVYEAKERSVFTVNESEVHGLYDASDNNIVASIKIDHRYFLKRFPRLQTMVFRTFAESTDGVLLDRLRAYLIKILTSAMDESRLAVQENIENVCELLEFLERHFNYFVFSGKTVVAENRGEEDSLRVERLSRIVCYIYDHHAEKITLDQLSSISYLSSNYISHLFKEGTGVSFRDFLCFARVEVSERYLLGSSMKISAISSKVGFSTTDFYIKHFQSWYGESPLRYREKYARHILGTRQAVRTAFSPAETLTAIDALMGVSSTDVIRLNLDDQPAAGERDGIRWRAEAGKAILEIDMVSIKALEIRKIKK